MAIELAVTVCRDLVTDMGLACLAEGKNCCTAVMIEIVRVVAGGRGGGECWHHPGQQSPRASRNYV